MGLLSFRPQRVQPYIYTKQEIERLLAARPYRCNYCHSSRGFYVRAYRASLPPHGRVGDWRAGVCHVSSPRHVERSMRFSRTTLT
jgi:hypothetical protein